MAVHEPLSGQFVSSFAYITIKDRLPVILTKVIDGLARNREAIVKKYGPDARDELKECIALLSKLKNEITTDKPLVAISNTGTDYKLWNEKLQEDENTTWFKSPWLLVECYMYRRIQESFDLTTRLQHYDPFEDLKNSSFRDSLPAIKILAKYLKDLKIRERCISSHQNFSQFVQVALWGNKCDLSLSLGNECSQTSNPMNQLIDRRPYILVNDTDQIWNCLQSASHDGRSVCVDFILDNAGYELFTDLCLADFLSCSGLVQKIKFHVKKMPWYVSDVTFEDFKWTIKAAKREPELAFLASQWKKNLEERIWTTVDNDFWTLPHDYSQMKSKDPQMYSCLAASNLLIFKGDLNYRKLTGDLNWPHTTPFKESLREFVPTALCALRTLKADVVVGLEPGQAESTVKKDQNWMISGEYAVIQFDS